MEEQLNLAYVAGLFDGEGCFSSYKDSGRLVPQMNICNTNMTLMDEVVRVLGHRYRIRLFRKQHNHKPTATWTVSAKKLIAFVDRLLPFLKAKKEQAFIVRLMARINVTHNRSRKNAVEQEWRPWLEEMMDSRLRELNKRGVE